jgi:steroid delta-isomerase-like uncharacterized protein
MADIAAIARQYSDAWNRRDWDTFKGLLHAEYSYTGGDGVRQDGPEAGLGVGQMFATAFPDGKIDVQRVHVAGDTAIVEFIGRGTHKGDLMGIPPTGKSISIPVVDILEIRDGKIHTEREVMDFAHMMQQLGVMPAAATA